MIDLYKLIEKFSLKGVLDFERRTNGFIFLTISNQYANAEICLYGAQITSYKPVNKPDILWMSSKSNFEAGKAIRGGIPVCFPWFGPHKTDSHKPQHGFGRLMFWSVTKTAVSASGETLISLQLNSSELTKAYWPYEFIAVMNILVGKTLNATLIITNKTSVQFEYSCALHSYYNLSDIETITIGGLGGTRYHKHNEPGDFLQRSGKLEIQQVEDRHYYDTEATCIIEDPGFQRKIRVAKSGSRVTTVWNPWADGCLKMSDMASDAYKSFVCVETVNSFEDTVILKPGESHETSVNIGMEE